MRSILQTITEQFQFALEKLFPDGGPHQDAMVRRVAEKKFGDYQSNVAMPMAKKLGQSPRDIAQQIARFMDDEALFQKVEIAGPGFINLFLNPEYLANELTRLKHDARMGVEPVPQPITHVIDFSSPNLAKEMHVGHLRTTITGEVIARVVEFMGHPVERVNHVGDWGTQFGMLLQYIYEKQPEVVAAPEKFHVKDLETFYKQAKALFDADPVFADKARQKVVLLQSGDPTAEKLWRAFLNESLRECHEIYKILGVTLKDVGESFYQDRLASTVKDLQDRGLARENEGATCVFLDGFVNREGEALPMIIKKSDGGYNYSTTDLAAIQYRIFERHAKRLIYVTDIRQEQHFAMIFALARKAGWATPDIELSHIGYGMVLGADRKPFKTRDGGTVRLKDLINESIDRARDSIKTGINNPEQGRVRNFSPEQIENIARVVGLAAIKYSDLSHNLASDYVFSWDKMLAMDGNTGPYMLYAYARIQSIGRKGGINLNDLPEHARLILNHPAEVELAMTLSRFPDLVNEVALHLKPNQLTDYLYGLSKAFSGFYDKKLGVPVLDAETEELKLSRLLLCHLTAQTLKIGLTLLSIETVDEM